MTRTIQLIIIAIMIIGFIIIINYIRKNKLELKYALSWLTSGIVVIVFACFPTVMKRLAKVMGIISPVNIVFFLGFCFSLIIMFTLTVALSITSSSVKRLTQKVALLEKQLDNANNQKVNDKKDIVEDNN